MYPRNHAGFVSLCCQENRARSVLSAGPGGGRTDGQVLWEQQEAGGRQRIFSVTRVSSLAALPCLSLLAYYSGMKGEKHESSKR